MSKDSIEYQIFYRNSSEVQKFYLKVQLGFCRLPKLGKVLSKQYKLPCKESIAKKTKIPFLLLIQNTEFLFPSILFYSSLHIFNFLELLFASTFIAIPFYFVILKIEQIEGSCNKKYSLLTFFHHAG